MILGSTLARDASVEVIAKVQTTNPKDAEAWSKDVEQPALDLDRAFKTLSAGWGLGLLGTTLCIWSMALSKLTDALNTPRNVGMAIHIGEGDKNPDEYFVNHLIWMAIITPLPLFLAHDVASTSSCADRLMDTLNEARMEHGKEADVAITWLERSLSNLNHGQGLGFTVGGAVLDRKTLRTLGITLAGGITTLITALLTLADTEAGAVYQDESAANCALSAVQREVIKSVLGNSSCAQNEFEAFNRSLASYLA